MLDTSMKLLTGERAAIAIQRNWRRRVVTRRRAINRILAVVRGKQGRNRALRMRELKLFQSKAMHLPRVVLITLVYAVIIFLTLLCMYINLIFGIKFTKDEQAVWVWATYIGLFLDWGVYSTSKIVLQWLLPPYITEVLFLLLVVGFVALGVFCEEVMDPVKRPWTADLGILCEIPPV